MKKRKTQKHAWLGWGIRGGGETGTPDAICHDAGVSLYSQMVYPSPPLLFSFFSAFHHGERRHERLGHEHLPILVRTTTLTPNPITPSLARYFSHSRKDHLRPPHSALPPPPPGTPFKHAAADISPGGQMVYSGVVCLGTPPSPPEDCDVANSGPLTLTSAKRGAPLWPVRASFLFFLVPTRSPSNPSADSRLHLTNPESFLIWTKKE